MSKAVLEHLQAKFGAKILETSSAFGDDCAVVEPSAWHEIALFLRDDPACDMSMFIDITAVDYPNRDRRFDVILFLYSLHKKHRIRLKTRLFHETDARKHGEATPTEVPTVCDVWLAANWFEREVWDMFGVRFTGHPDLRRLLLYEEFQGHPLRKDYPVQKTQPLVPYREGPDVMGKLPPFGDDEGLAFTRKDWLPKTSKWDADS